MPERVSPPTTVYIWAVPAVDWGVTSGLTSLTVRWGFCRTVSVCGPGVSPPRVRPARAEQTGQAPGPCPSRTFSATAICWSLVARSARVA